MPDKKQSWVEKQKRGNESSNPLIFPLRQSPSKEDLQTLGTYPLATANVNTEESITNIRQNIDKQTFFNKNSEMTQNQHNKFEIIANINSLNIVTPNGKFGQNTYTKTFELLKEYSILDKQSKIKITPSQLILSKEEYKKIINKLKKYGLENGFDIESNFSINSNGEIVDIDYPNGESYIYITKSSEKFNDGGDVNDIDKKMIYDSIRRLVYEDRFKETAMVPIDEVWQYREFDRKNEPIKGDDYLDKIKSVIKKDGFTKPLKLSIDGLLIDGNHRIAAAKELGLKYVPVKMSLSPAGVNKHLAKGIDGYFRNQFNHIWNDKEYIEKLKDGGEVKQKDYSFSKDLLEKLKTSKNDLYFKRIQFNTVGISSFEIKDYGYKVDNYLLTTRAIYPFDSSIKLSSTKADHVKFKEEIYNSLSEKIKFSEKSEKSAKEGFDFYKDLEKNKVYAKDVKSGDIFYKYQIKGNEIVGSIKFQIENEDSEYIDGLVLDFEGEIVEYDSLEKNEIIREIIRGYAYGELNTNKYAKGGNISLQEREELYEKWKDKVNMTASELRSFYNSKEGKEAGLSKAEADKLGIKSGRESARWILKMKETPIHQWTPEMIDWASRQISFISRMSGVRGKLYKNDKPTRKLTALKIWGHNPEK